MRQRGAGAGHRADGGPEPPLPRDPDPALRRARRARRGGATRPASAPPRLSADAYEDDGLGRARVLDRGDPGDARYDAALSALGYLSQTGQESLGSPVAHRWCEMRPA